LVLIPMLYLLAPVEVTVGCGVQVRDAVGCGVPVRVAVGCVGPGVEVRVAVGFDPEVILILSMFGPPEEVFAVIRIVLLPEFIEVVSVVVAQVSQLDVAAQARFPLSEPLTLTMHCLLPPLPLAYRTEMT
jgi:hypothetical protein